MSTIDVGTASSTEMEELSTIDMALEVVTVPVSDVDRAKRFYQSLGWRLDIALFVSDDFRQVHMTPPHSQCSIHFGKGITAMEPGSLDRLYLAVKDIDAAREDLASRGVDVTEVEEQPKPPGFDLPGRSYFAYASFKDPDGNGWLLQEVTTRLPGREWQGWQGRRVLGRSAARDRRASRLLRGGCPTPRLVGLVRGVHGRPPERERFGRGLRRGRALHGGRQAHRRLSRLTPAVVAAPGDPALPRGVSRQASPHGGQAAGH